MALQSQFTAAEWETLQFAPLWVLAGIGTADGRLDQKESEKFSELMVRLLTANDELVREVITTLVIDLKKKMEAFKADTRKIDVGLGEVADILEAKAAAHADEFKKVMLSIAANIANASGRLLGDKLDDREKAAFVIIAASLRAPL